MADSTTQMFGGRVATVGEPVRVKMWETEWSGLITGVEPQRDVPYIQWGPEDRSWGWDRDWDEFFFTACATQADLNALGDLCWTWPVPPEGP